MGDGEGERSVTRHPHH